MKRLLEGTQDIYYIGADDREMRLFENQYHTPEGISYNSYLIRDEKCIVMDTADERVADKWFANLEEALDGREPDYLVVHHMEPDHSACVKAFSDKYPDAKLIVNAKTLTFLEQFFDEDFTEKSVLVKEGDMFETGSHSLKFIMAPMVHWPEVMVAYDLKSKALFSADAFGTFGTLEGNITEPGDDWAREASRYYINIVGKYGNPVSNLLKKVVAAAPDLKMICPLHGPVLTQDIGRYLEYYTKWSAYEADLEGTFIVHASLHGNTRDIAIRFGQMLQHKGEAVAFSDLTTDDIPAAVAKAFRFGKIVLMSSTYEGDIMPAMNDFLYRLTLKGCMNKRIGIVENYSWGPVAGKKMRAMVEAMKGMEIAEPLVSVKTRLTAETEAEIVKLADVIIDK